MEELNTEEELLKEVLKTMPMNIGIGEIDLTDPKTSKIIMDSCVKSAESGFASSSLK